MQAIKNETVHDLPVSPDLVTWLMYVQSIDFGNRVLTQRKNNLSRGI